MGSIDEAKAAAALRASAHARKYVSRCDALSEEALASPSHASSGTTCDGATQLCAAHAHTRRSSQLRRAAWGVYGTEGG